VRARRLAFAAGLLVAAAAALAFLVLPLVAVFARVPLRHLLDQLESPVARDALRLTAETNLASLAILLVVGTPAAYLVASHRFWGRSIVVTLIELPLVLPPAVAGIGLLAAYNSRIGLVPGPLEFLGLSLDFTTAAVVVAVLFVSSPFYLRQAIAAFETVDRDYLDASRTLGSGPARTFARVALPLAAGGLGAGAALALARGIGEFGATIMFAGNYPGRTQTLPLAIYQQFEGPGFNTALALGALLIVVSAAILLVVKLLGSWTRSVSTSPFRSVTSASTSTSS
jgi:molybdate transport system permease protein